MLKALLPVPVLATGLACSGAEAPTAGLPIPPPAEASGCIDNGFVAAELFGSINGRLDWTGKSLRCEGMPRPGRDGARLRFAADERALIIAIPKLEPGRNGRELPANVTLIEESTARFFGTTDVDSCWVDISTNESRTDSLSVVGGRLYCIAPIAEVNGDGAVTINELEFLGIVDWGDG